MADRLPPLCRLGVHAVARSVVLALLAVPLCTCLHAQIPAAAYPGRRTAVMARLGADVLVVPARASLPEADQHGLSQAPDFQYLTGLEELIGSVLVIDGATSAAILFVAPMNPRLTHGVLPPGAESARSLRLSDVLSIDALEPWLRQRFAGRRPAVHVASTDARGAVEVPLPMARSVSRWQAWLTALGAGSVRSAVDLLRPLREIKDDNELEALRRVGTASREATLAGIRAIAPGVWEHRAELAVVDACHGAGARGISFWPWTLSGPNATFSSMWRSSLAYDHLDRQMKAGELVRVDVGCQIDHYMGDVGRTVPVSGVFTGGQREAWDLFIAGYRAGLVRIKDGVAATSVYEDALAEVRRRAASLETAEGKQAAAVLLGPHATDAWALHGVGLQDAEGAPPVLRAGMVVAYELMFMVDGEAFYLEDMIAVTRDGYELLTPGLPYTAREIEAVMAKPKR